MYQGLQLIILYFTATIHRQPHLDADKLLMISRDMIDDDFAINIDIGRKLLGTQQGAGKCDSNAKSSLMLKNEKMFNNLQYKACLLYTSRCV